MTMTLPPRLESLAMKLVEAGGYADVNSMLIDAIRELELRKEHERKSAALRAQAILNDDSVQADLVTSSTAKDW